MIKLEKRYENTQASKTNKNKICKERKIQTWESPQFKLHLL